jgi:hypothetical protein
MPGAKSRKPRLSEAKNLLRNWDAGTFSSRNASIRYHLRKHALAIDLWVYLRQASAFRNRGSRRKRKSDGTITYSRKSGEFLIEKNAKIISYGKH